MTAAARKSKLEEGLLELDGPINEASSMADVLDDLWLTYSTPAKPGQNLVLTGGQVRNITFAVANVADLLTKILGAFNAAGKSVDGGKA